MDGILSTAARDVEGHRAGLMRAVADVLEMSVEELDGETDLLATGRLDSLAIVTLVDYMEEVMGVRVPIDHVVPENFRSVGRMLALVRELGSAGRT